jgi:hypothetical protein
LYDAFPTSLHRLAAGHKLGLLRKAAAGGPDQVVVVVASAARRAVAIDLGTSGEPGAETAAGQDGLIVGQAVLALSLGLGAAGALDLGGDAEEVLAKALLVDAALAGQREL